MLAAAVATVSPFPAWTRKIATADAGSQAALQAITVGVVQQARERVLAVNRDKIARCIGQAKDRGCRLVIFPEDAQGSPVGTLSQGRAHDRGAFEHHE